MEDILESNEVVEMNNKFLKSTSLTMDSFENEECIGVGGYGKVFRVKDKKSQLVYALKVLNGNQLARQNLWK